MKAKGLGWWLWRLVGLPLTVIGVITALGLVFGILGLVFMFVAVLVPFGLAMLALIWLSRKIWSGRESQGPPA